MIAGLETVTDGTVEIGGMDVSLADPSDRGVTMVFQSYALYPHMNVYDNMAFSLKMNGVARDEIDTRVRRAADILGLHDLLERKPKALSGGQRQRVAIGRSIVREPKIFLFDEPLSNLDAELRVQMRLEIARLHQDLGATMIYVTHDQVEAMTLADKIVILRDGLIEQVGAPQTLYRDPDNMFVGGFIGSPRMNFLDGEITGETGRCGDCQLSDFDCGDRRVTSFRNTITNITIATYRISTCGWSCRPSWRLSFMQTKSFRNSLTASFCERTWQAFILSSAIIALPDCQSAGCPSETSA